MDLMPREETPAPAYLFSVHALLTEREQLLQQEERDRALAATIEFPNVIELGETLRQWAIAGFPSLYPVLKYSFGLPSTCSDGVSRSFYDYFQYLVGSTVTEQIQKLQAKLDGIVIECEYTGPSAFTLRVSRA